MRKSKLWEIAAAIACAIFLWMYVVTVVTPDDDVTVTNIPVVFQGESKLSSEHELIISKKSAATVTVKFHGSRVDLKRLSDDKSGVTAVVDVSQFTSEREYSVGYDIVLPSALQDNVVQIVDRSPRTIQFTVEKLANKQVPVKGLFDGTLAPGFVEGDLLFDQDTVKVTGPKELVDQVNYAQVVVGGSNVSETFTRPVSITLFDNENKELHSNDLMVSAQEIQVTLQVLMEKTVPVTASYVYGPGAMEEFVSVDIRPETLTLRGPAEALEDLTEVSLGEIVLANMQDDVTMPVDIVLPEDVTADSEETQAQVTATFDGLEILKLPVTKILPENLAEGMTAKNMTSELMVTLRGPSEELEAFEESALKAVADLSGYNQTGSFTVPVRIETGSETIGAVGEYTVTVEMKAMEVQQ